MFITSIYIVVAMNIYVCIVIYLVDIFHFDIKETLAATIFYNIKIQTNIGCKALTNQQLFINPEKITC